MYSTIIKTQVYACIAYISGASSWWLLADASVVARVAELFLDSRCSAGVADESVAVFPWEREGTVGLGAAGVFRASGAPIVTLSRMDR